jgi:hypothetical protein
MSIRPNQTYLSIGIPGHDRNTHRYRYENETNAARPDDEPDGQEEAVWSIVCVGHESEGEDEHAEENEFDEVHRARHCIGCDEQRIAPLQQRQAAGDR